MSLKRSLYTLFLYLIFPLVLFRLILRSRANPDYRKRWSERLGFISLQNKPVIWVHAVSVGEAIAAKPLIEGLLKTYTNTPILVTTTTPTGSDRVTAMFSEQIEKQKLVHVYFPYDLLGAVARFVKSFQPLVLIVVETEIWPNLYAKCYQKSIPIVMVNARLSEKSTQSYLRIKNLVSETLSKVSVIAVRSKIDAERFMQLGAKSQQIQQTGNIKYDIKIDQNQERKAVKLLNALNGKAKSKDVQNKRLIYVAASTHKGEDSKIVCTYIDLVKQFPNLLLVLVPRHPERFDEVYDECISQLHEDLTIIRHSQNPSYEEFTEQHVNIIIGDSMGEMQMWFATADVVFIGGSLVKTGGHNPLEATLFGVPVVSGPYMFNFEDIATKLSGKGLSGAELLSICKDEFEVSKKVSQILTQIQISQKELDNKVSDSSSSIYNSSANVFMQQHQGVTARLLEIISKLLK